LSEFAGAAAELRGAILANPHDPAELVNSCYLGLTMKRAEARARMKEAYNVVRYNDIEQWGKEFMEAVSECKRAQEQVEMAASASDDPTPLDDDSGTHKVA